MRSYLDGQPARHTQGIVAYFTCTYTQHYATLTQIVLQYQSPKNHRVEQGFLDWLSLQRYCSLLVVGVHPPEYWMMTRQHRFVGPWTNRQGDGYCPELGWQ